MWEFLVRPFEGIAYDRAERIRRKTVDVFGGYISSTAAAALFDAVGIFIGLLILQVPLAVPLAILTFLLAFIPIIGAVSAGAVAALVALVSNGPLTAALVVLVVIVVNQLEGERPEADPDGKDGQPPRTRRAHRHRRGHGRRRNRRSPPRRPAHCRSLGRRAGVGRRRTPCAAGRARRVAGPMPGRVARPVPVQSRRTRDPPLTRWRRDDWCASRGGHRIFTTHKSSFGGPCAGRSSAVVYLAPRRRSALVELACGRQRPHTSRRYMRVTRRRPRPAARAGAEAPLSMSSLAGPSSLSRQLREGA